MESLRTFIACEIPPSLQAAIQAGIKDLRSKLDPDLVRWVAEGNVHLTFKFLGNVPIAKLELIQTLLANEASQYNSFEAIVEGVGCFPSSRRPRILWVGLTAPSELSSLQQGLEAGSVLLGYQPDKGSFSPHLTIGRVRQYASTSDLLRIRNAVESVKLVNYGVLRVDAIHLFKSDLRPTGAFYSKLFSASLGKV